MEDPNPFERKVEISVTESLKVAEMLGWLEGFKQGTYYTIEAIRAKYTGNITGG